MSDDCYNALVLDSGAIINQSSLQLIQKAKTLYTVEGVIQEVRDSKSKEYLNQLQLQKQILIREPSKQATNIVANFARITGDYSYLSRVDIQLIGLQYDLGTHESFPLVKKKNFSPPRFNVLFFMLHMKKGKVVAQFNIYEQNRNGYLAWGKLNN